MGILDVPPQDKDGKRVGRLQLNRARSRARGSDRLKRLAAVNHPTSHAAPPAVSLNAGNGTIGGGTALTNSEFRPFTDSAFRFSCAQITSFGGMAYRPITTGPPPGAQTGATPAPILVSFALDCQSFEIVLRDSTAQNQKFRLAVDGQWISRTPESWLPNTGSQFYLRKFEFGSRAVRNFTLELTDFAQFGGIRLARTDTIMRPIGGSDKPFRVAVIADSYGHTVTGGLTCMAWAHQLGLMLGWEVDIINHGSTGLIATQGGNFPTYGMRVVNDLPANTYDAIIIQGSVNDSGGTPNVTTNPNDIGPALTSLLNYCATSNPDADVFVTSTVRSTSYSGADTQVTTIMSGICAARTPAVPFFDATDGGTSGISLFRGTGKINAQTGDGNADYCMSTDGIHPTEAGHLTIATWLAAKLSSYYGLAPDKTSSAQVGSLEDNARGILLPGGRAWSPGTANLNGNNFARWGRFKPARDVSAVSIAFVLNVLATNNDAIEVAFYDASTLAKVATTGSVSGLLNSGTVPLLKTASLSAPYTFEANRDYLYAFINSYGGGTAAQIYCANFQAAVMGDLFGTTTATKRWGTTTGIAPGSSAATAAIDASAGSANIPIVALREF